MKNLQALLRAQSHFTHTEKRMADFIMQNSEMLATLSLDDFSAKVYTSHSSIIRFAQKLGFEGYRELRYAISREYELAYRQGQAVDVNAPFLENDSPQEVAKKMADLTLNTIQSVYQMLDYEVLERAVTKIDESDRIFIFAKGDSQIRARSFQNKMMKLGRFIVLAEAYSDEAWVAHNIMPTDLAIFVSYSARSDQYESFMQRLTERAVPTVLISSDAKSQLAQLSPVVIVIDDEESYAEKVGTFHSQIAIDFILDTLYSLFYMRHYQQHKELLSRNYQLINKKDKGSMS